MHRLHAVVRRLLAALQRGRLERDLDDELAFHLAMRSAEHRGAGLSRAEAETRARRQFGSVTLLKESARHHWTFPLIESCLRDIRFAARGIRRSPAFSVPAVLMLAVGISTTVAVFSIVSGILLRPLPFREPERLVQLYGTPAVRGEAVDKLDEYRRQSTSFEALVGYGVSARYLRFSGESERVMAVVAERGFFQMLGASPLAGRTFSADDPATVAVVGAAFWNDRLHGDPAVLGRTVMLDGTPFTIIGIMPPSFQFPYSAASTLPGAVTEYRTDVWIPYEPPSDPALREASRFNYVTGRLKQGVSISTAGREMAVISSRIQHDGPDRSGGRGVRLEPLSETITKSVRAPLLVLFGVVIVVLALICGNVTNLLLVRAISRSREISIRLALGAGFKTLVRQLLTESLVLALSGGFAGFLLSLWLTELLTALFAVYLPRAHEVNADWRVLGFAVALSVLAAGVISVPAILTAVRNDPALQNLGHPTIRRESRRFRDGVVVAEVALVFALGAAAASLVRELVRLTHTDTGMDTANVLTFHLGERPSWWGTSRRGAPSPADVRPFYELEDRVLRLPGVQAAGFTQLLPLQNWGWSANSADFRMRTRPPAPAPPFSVQLRYVTPGYFRALGIPIKRGRSFTIEDSGDARPVILINETLSRELFSDEDPVGKETTRGTIVGIAGDVRQTSIDRAPAPEVYYPIAQNYSQLLELGMTLIVKTSRAPDALVAPIRQVVRDVAPSLTVFNIKSMDEVVAESLGEFTSFLSLVTAFAATALLLTMGGTYAVMSFAAASRNRELAVRVALGATPARIAGLVLAQGGRLVGVGLILGLIALPVIAPLLRNMPVDVRAPGLALIASLALLITTMGIAACYVPARRAAKADPLIALRCE